MNGRGQVERKRPRIRLGVLALAAASVATLGLAPSAGAFAWGSPVTVADAGQKVSTVGAPRVATDSAGDLMVAWLSNATIDPDQGVQACPCVVRAAFRPAGGSFGAPENVSPTIANPDDALEVQLAMDGAGEAIVGYTAPANPSNKDALPDTAYAAVRPAGTASSFDAPQVLASPGGPDGASLNFLKMDANGDAIAAVNNQQPFTGADAEPGDTVFDAEIVARPAGGSFDKEHPQILSTGTEDAYPRALSMSANGHAVLAMETTTNDQEANPDAAEPNSVEVATSDIPGAAFAAHTAVETVSLDPGVGVPEVIPETAAINDAGDYVVGYTKAITDETSQAKASINGGAPALLNPSGDNASTSPRMVINPSGEAVAVVSNSDGGPAVSVRPAGGTFGPATALSDDFLFGTVANAANLPSANGDVVYSFDGDDNGSVEASIRPAGGSFPVPTALAPDDDDPTVAGTDAAIDPAGDAAVTWIGPNGSVRAAIGLASSPTPPPPGGGGGSTPPKIGAPKVNAKNGTAKLPVIVDGAGKVVLTGKGIKKVTETVSEGKAHKITLVVKPVGALAKKLKKTGKATVKVKVTFTPTGGKTLSSTKSLKLVEKRR